MGMHVVAKLAHRHGLTVELIRGVPGITVKVTIPRDRLETTRPAEPPRETDRSEGVSDEVIDLTQPSMRQSEQPVPVSAPEPATAAEAIGDLPVRTPGQAFRDEEAAQSIVAGEGATSIKTALSDYERGHRAAEDPPGDEK